MSTFVKYGNFSFSGSSGYPVPQISMSLEVDRDNTGRSLSARNVINLEGQIYASGASGFLFLAQAESGLRSVFTNNRANSLSFGCNNQTLYSGFAKVNRYTADKTENRWLITINYNIDLEVEVTGANLYNVSSIQDEWSLEPLDDFSYVPSPFPGATTSSNNSNFPSSFNFITGPSYPAYRVSRTIGAVGKFVPTGSGNSGIGGLANAQKWVKDQIGSGLKIQPALSGLTLYNFIRSVNASEAEGSYRITDTFLAISGVSGYTESFSVESSLDSSYLRTVTINGTIKGLEAVNTGYVDSSGGISSGLSGIFYPTVASGRGSGSKFGNAVSGYNTVKSGLFTRCQAFVATGNDPNGVFNRLFGRNESPLNPIPLSITEGFNPPEGTVTYSWAYNNRPLNLVSGSISETLTVDDTFPAQEVAEVFVIGRRLGPVLQDLGTYTSASRNVTFEVVMLRPTGLAGLRFPKTAYTAITGVVESFNPQYLLGSSFCKSFVKANSESWNVTEGRFVKQKNWSWTKCDSIPTINLNTQ